MCDLLSVRKLEYLTPLGYTMPYARVNFAVTVGEKRQITTRSGNALKCVLPWLSVSFGHPRLFWLPLIGGLFSRIRLVRLPRVELGLGVSETRIANF